MLKKIINRIRDIFGLWPTIQYRPEIIEEPIYLFEKSPEPLIFDDVVDFYTPYGTADPADDEYYLLLSGVWKRIDDA